MIEGRDRADRRRGRLRPASAHSVSPAHPRHDAPPSSVWSRAGRQSPGYAAPPPGAQTSNWRLVSPYGFACVAGRGPRGRPRAPAVRSCRRSISAAGRAPSRSKIARALRWAASSPSISASACSYGQPICSQASAAACQSPAIWSAYGAATPAAPGSVRPRARARRPVVRVARGCCACMPTRSQSAPPPRTARDHHAARPPQHGQP